MEEEVVECDALSSESPVLGVLPALHAPQGSPPNPVGQRGYKAKQGYVVYRICVHCSGRKRPVPKGVTYAKPVHHGVNQLKFARSLQSFAEE
ncbi:60S ribosomal protein L15 [Sciurus carolinensis]|uniref:Ribosomal protein L15 n=1 Tax=Sciurus carolinensis TaxID=30640 RepID=A0AA41N2R8_SCICA|nr:60S ribosomal protein L15 [Sciurus carolinensis]